MQELWTIIKEQSIFVYVIAGIGFLGVVSKLLLQGRLRGLMKASEMMSSTTKRQIRTIRNQYENSLNMDLQIHNIRAFVDKHLLKLKFLGIPLRIWDSLAIEAALLSVAAGGIGIIHTIYQGYGEDVVFSILGTTIISCACLVSVENIFRIENSFDRLQANIEDYLENNLRNRLGRPLLNRQSRSQRLAAVTTEASSGDGISLTGERRERAQTPSAGRADTRPVEETAAAGKSGEANAGYSGYMNDPEYAAMTPAEREAAAGQEAEVVAQVLRNFFSS